MGDAVNVWAKVYISEGGKMFAKRMVTRFARVPCIGERVTFEPGGDIYRVLDIEHTLWTPREDWSAVVFIERVDND